MGELDRKQFRDAVTDVKKARLGEDWTPVMTPLLRLAMFDMLPVLAALSPADRARLRTAADTLGRRVSAEAWKRLMFAFMVVDNREIVDYGLPHDQVNDGRVFLGCTPLDDDGVRREIALAESEARAMISGGYNDPDGGCNAARAKTDEGQCCGVTLVAWEVVLVGKRRQFAGASQISNLAAAAHYMLAKWHVCAGRARRWQMNTVIEGYDDSKRYAIANGDKNLATVAITPGNNPYPPDFAIRAWAQQGSADGEQDHLRCNKNAKPPLVFPTVTDKEY